MSPLITVEQARRQVSEACRPLDHEAVALRDAQGRVLAEQVRCAVPVPPFENSAMDGYAIRCADVVGAGDGAPVALRVVDESRAGHPARRAVQPGEAIAISTGAMIPEGADSVIAVEQTRELDGRVYALAEVPPGSHVRRHGEDIEAGELVLSSGSVLGAPQLGVLASLGAAQVSCVRRPRVALVITGDELRDPGAPLPPGTIHNSNAYSLPALVRRSGAELVGLHTVADRPQDITEAIGQGLAAADVTIVCGGVSVGAHDHVKDSLAALGAQQRFWGVALKPGKPTWFGTHTQKLAFGLPGNPVSAMVTFLLFVAPALRVLGGREPAPGRHLATFTRVYRKRPGRAHAVRCHAFADHGGWRADPFADAGSHVLTSMLGANALAIVPAERADVQAGEQVEIELIGDLCGEQP